MSIELLIILYSSLYGKTAYILSDLTALPVKVALDSLISVIVNFSLQLSFPEENTEITSPSLKNSFAVVPVGGTTVKLMSIFSLAVLFSSLIILSSAQEYSNANNKNVTMFINLDFIILYSVRLLSVLKLLGYFW